MPSNIHKLWNSNEILFSSQMLWQSPFNFLIQSKYLFLSFWNHPSIILIKEKSKNLWFIFHEVYNEKTIKEIKTLNKNKASQKFEILITIIHENADSFSYLLASH